MRSGDPAQAAGLFPTTPGRPANRVTPHGPSITARFTTGTLADPVSALPPDGQPGTDQPGTDQPGTDRRRSGALGGDGANGKVTSGNGASGNVLGRGDLQSGSPGAGTHRAEGPEADTHRAEGPEADTHRAEGPEADTHRAGSPEADTHRGGCPEAGPGKSGPEGTGRGGDGRYGSTTGNGHARTTGNGHGQSGEGSGQAAIHSRQETGQPGRHRYRSGPVPSYRDVFRAREFRALWLAQVLSYAGDQFAQVAIAILVYDRTRSPLLTALAYALTYLPPILGSPLLSGLADIFPRRRVMIAVDLMRAALVAGMVVPGLPFAGLCSLLFLTVLLGPPFSAARSSLLPDLLPPGQFVLATAIGNITFQASQIAGFVAGAAVVAALGPHRALAADALSFCLSAMIVATGVRARPAPAAGTARGRPSLWDLTLDGASIVFGRPVLRTLVLLGWLAGFTVVPEGLAAPYGHDLGGGPITVGLLMAAMPAGMIVGAYVLGRLARPATRLRLIGWLAMLSCAPLMVSLAHPPLWAVLALWAVAGAGGAYQLAAAAAFVQALPAGSRGRAFGIAQSGLLASQGLGILAAGAAAQWIGPEAVVAIAGIAGLITAATLASAWSCQHGELLRSAACGPCPAAGPAIPAGDTGPAGGAPPQAANGGRPGPPERPQRPGRA
jgi:MFS family permease